LRVVFHYEKIDEAIAKLKIDVTKKKPGQILFLGRLAANKGIHFLIDALPKVLQKHPNAKLIIQAKERKKPPLKAR
jgi:glycosyltransferase involved in cell wall biosynthesis